MPAFFQPNFFQGPASPDVEAFFQVAVAVPVVPGNNDRDDGYILAQAVRPNRHPRIRVNVAVRHSRVPTIRASVFAVRLRTGPDLITANNQAIRLKRTPKVNTDLAINAKRGPSIKIRIL